ncbi:MAG: PEP-CTERM sorting domain-containing protein [Chthoniobacterales bacterium]|nr:PEP-CTERM sorting domain-containing protein [Chthoniobacterales bacterium]
MKNLRLCLCGLLLLPLTVRAATQYEILSFNLLAPSGGFTNSFAYGLNESGQVVGTGQYGVGPFSPFLYDNGIVTPLSPGSGFDEATAINNGGSIVGNIGFDASSYAGGGSWTPLGSLGSTSFVYDVNASGFAVGEAFDEGPGNFRAVSYSNGIATDLGTLGGSASVARAVNTAGQIVGNADLAGDVFCHAFIYQGGAMSSLGTLLGEDACSFAYGINAAGQVVGWSDTSDGAFRAFLWDADGGMVDLGSLTGHEFSEARDINNLGQVVGGALSYSSDEAAILFDEGVWWNLQDLVVNMEEQGFSALRTAYRINDAGQIIGIGLDHDLNTVGFLLNPVPEPSTGILAALGLAGILLCRRVNF